MFRPTGFDKLLDKATSHLLMEIDWVSIIQICDLIRQGDITPKYALNQVKKKILSTNQHTAMYALLVLEAIVKNCGSGVHEELTTKAYCEVLHDLVKTTPYENVRNKTLELIQTWSVAFRKNAKLGLLKDTVTLMRAEGYKFPTARESDAMFLSDTAPEWADGAVCHRCRVAFGVLQRKHHCRACGQVFCGQCTQKSTTLPKYGIEKEVRVCDVCYEQVNKPSTTKIEKETELPPEYVNSSLAQQSQVPPQKTEEELREEDELNLAIAISKSEAEAKEKEKEKMKLASTYKTPEPQRVVERPVTPEEEQINPELARYLNRSYWESVNQADNSDVRPTSPSAPVVNNNSAEKIKVKENGVVDNNLEEFIVTIKSQLEIFINRMKSNSSRGRSIANDSSVQTFFLNITQMHSKLLRFIQEHDDRRLYYEQLQDKLTQIKDARAALDDLRAEHRERLRRDAEEAERQRQLQMAHKLEIMRKKKQEFLEYQRQVALKRIQEQEREMQMRQEQQKQQYLMSGGQYGAFIPQQMHAQHPPPPPMPSTPFYYGGPMMSTPGMPRAPQPSYPIPGSPMPQNYAIPTGPVPMHLPPQQQGPQFPQQQRQQPIAPPQMQQQSPHPPQTQQQPQSQGTDETQTGELISFD